MKITLAFQHTLKENSTRFEIFYTSFIKIWTRSKYFHVETILEDKWISSTPAKDGVYIRDIKPLNVKLYDYVEVDVGRKSKNKIEKALTYVKSLENHGYDFLGVFMLGIGVNKDNKTKEFCSEVAVDILKLLNPKLLYLDSNQYSPDKLYKEVIKLK